MVTTRDAEPHETPQAAQGRHGRQALRFAPVAGVAVALLLFYAFGLQDYLSLEALRRYRGSLDAFVASHAILAPATYLAVYAAVVAVSFPGASFLTIVGGFLFGAVFGAAFAALGATLGATALFLIARTSLGDALARRAGPRGARLRAGFQQDAFSYLLFLRLVPLFPFWLVNLAAALFGMRLLPYVAATALGILPTTFVFAYFGEGLETTLDAGSPAPPRLFLTLLLPALLVLALIVVRRWRRARPGTPLLRDP